MSAVVVWFKRDLRLADHAALQAAVQSGRPVICLYVFEPLVYGSPEYDRSHYDFIRDCLIELDSGLRERGGHLEVRAGNMVDVLEELWKRIPLEGLFSHEETGNLATYQRDRDVRTWCRFRGVPWKEFRQDGVIRRLTSRDGWSRRWERFVSVPPLPAVVSLRSIAISEPFRIPLAEELGISGQPKDTPSGGERPAADAVNSFLQFRGLDYRKAMSSPVAGWDACSRLSPFLAHGCISLREVWKQTMLRVSEIRNGIDPSISPREKRTWLASLRSFQSRLRWRCHFMQKLEDQPDIEIHNFVRAYDGLREDFTASDEGRERLFAWMEGRTGYPMVDACMRCVTSTGWLNFRMRAMLVSFASYHLWLDWRPTARHLARHFLDFEPGIHYSQFQMQSGTTGINTVRIYSPVKQAMDQDPTGVFVRRWVPELSGVPDTWIFEPHKMPFDLQILSRNNAVGIRFQGKFHGDWATALQLGKSESNFSQMVRHQGRFCKGTPIFI